jgi:hypothetical protein
MDIAIAWLTKCPPKAVNFRLINSESLYTGCPNTRDITTDEGFGFDRGTVRNVYETLGWLSSSFSDER